MPYKMTNKEVVLKLKEVLAAMEVKNLDRFRVRAYQIAISSIDGLTSSVYDLWENGKLDEIPGVGASLNQHLDELFATGKAKQFDAVMKDLPEGMFSLIGIRGVGAKTAFKLATAFKLNKRDTAIEKAKKAAESGKIRVLAGFGEKSEKDILESIENLKKTKQESSRMLLYQAEEIANRILEYMNKFEEVKDIKALGSLRRRASTVGDMDIAVATNKPKEVTDLFLKFPEIDEILDKGEKKCRVTLKNGVQVDFRVIDQLSFGAMIQYFTGSKQHNVILRTHALSIGMSLSEYGIKTGDKQEVFSNEDDFYKRIGLQYIPPEIRHGKEEVELAARGKIPRLVELSDIRGDVHTHTIASDGVNSIKDMVNAGIDLGYSYIGICDHSPSVQSRGKYEVLGLMQATRTTIEQINDSQDIIRVLFGYEVNILSDGTLSMPNEMLKKLDYCVASIHTSFDQDRDVVTKRMLLTLENPYVTVIGHPSGRLINQREACNLDWEKVFESAIKNNKILEINAQPSRLDLADDLVADAVKKGIRLMINTDAHSTGDLKLMKYGIDVARRGMCTKENLLNTLSRKDFVDNFVKEV
ncbi:hypothetical protein A3H26_03840 [candidate division WWE3 bacterium RIFCSPLOWO2_12_FULL_36_10]|uniref:DNA-directed DNA polymerase n=1 Tax=candidate division WWE3 bacterium RIFCSPLOWO2_12_FULL_36_10 TaxID=1802630 RepID=A0A1F4VKD7_UNCKA|nr:MAG: hypothetical protein A3H26_03840 [candidate division WWE3 bacterium RIFCSPLOWO2_12_FULL_36_10]